MKTITIEWLDKMGACADQADLAALHFGRSAPLTRATLLEASALGLSIDWLALNLLPPKQWEALGLSIDWLALNLLPPKQREAYQAQVAPLWEAYQAQVANLIADMLGLK